MLYKIHLALTIAKECDKPFGGINVIFAGDFCQLPAVGDTRMYTKFSKRKRTGTEKSNLQAVYGKLLWLSIQNVIILQTVERQRGSGADQLISLLSRLREGKCTINDYQFLNGRQAGKLLTNTETDHWQDAPIIVTENATKDALNVASAEAFARRTGRQLFWYYSLDTHKGNVISELDLRSHLYSLTSNTTNNRLGRIPLVIGMPVMVMTNFDVAGGVVNGRIGQLKSVDYWVDDHGFRHATSCVIESVGITGDPLPGLQKNEAVALQDVTELDFIHPHSKKRCKIKRTQLPIQPAFSMTSYKSQGLSLDRVIVDIESCSGSEAPYVMVSRVKSLDGLMILRPFDRSKICCNLKQDLRDELKRQRLLELATLARYGEGRIASEAAQQIDHLSLNELLTDDNVPLSLTNCNLDSLVRRENHVTHQVMMFLRDTFPHQGFEDSTSARKRPRMDGDESGMFLQRSRIAMDMLTNYAAQPTKNRFVRHKGK